MKISNLSKVAVTLILLCETISCAFGQATQKQIIPPSPNAAAFAKYGNIPVSAYTGVPSISIPIYEIKVRDISVPISISYHASGIKVSEEASRIGLGWVLNAGGVISRNVIGYDDFFLDPRGYLNSSNTSEIVPSGPQFVPIQNIQGGVVAKFLNTAVQQTVNLDLLDDVYGSDVDFEPDQFNFNIPGGSGKFVLDRQGNAIIEQQEKTLITNTGNGTTWQITTADGTRYTFAATETSLESGEGGRQQISAWYLTEITSPQGEKVTFHYQNVPNQFIRPVGQFRELIQGNQFSCSVFGCTPYNPVYAAMPVTQYHNLYLSSITWKNGKIEFEMEDREDVEGDKRVKAIKIFEETADNQYAQLNEFGFGYGYFENSVSGNVFPMPSVQPNYLSKRLKLVSLTNKPTDVSSSVNIRHQFSYYDAGSEDNLPQKNSFARDHWGYYNGKTGNISLIPSYKRVLVPNSFAEISGIMGSERNPSATNVRAYSLKDITYPTGGKTTFHYGINDFDLIPGAGGGNPEIYQVPEFFVYNASSLSGTVYLDTLDLRAQYISPTGSTLPIEVSAAFVGNDPCFEDVSNGSDIYFEIYPVGGGTAVGRVSLTLAPCSNAGESDCLYCDPNQTSYGAAVYKGLVTLQPGKYVWRAFAHSNQNRIQTISAGYTWWADAEKRSPLGENVKYVYGGGIRVERIEDHEPITNTTNVRKFDYHYNTDVDEDGVPEIHSYGKRMVQPNYSYFEVRWEKKVLSTDPPIAPVCLDCAYILRQSDSYIPVTGSQGNSVGYTQVTEIVGINGDNGKIKYEYENESDAIMPANYPYGSYSIKPALISTNPNPQNGMLLRKTEFSASGVPIHQVVNDYSKKFDKIIYGIENRRVQAIGFGSFDYGTAYASLNVPYAEVLLSVYPALRSSFYFLSSSAESYFHDNQEFRTVTTYSYDNSEHLQMTKLTQEKSDGSKRVTTYKYSADFSNAEADAAILAMKVDKHMHNVPIETVVMDQAAETVFNVTNSEITVFDIYSDKVFPKETARLQRSSVLPLTEYPPYVPAVGYDVNLFRKELTLEYNDQGNVKKIQKTNDYSTSYLWGYRNTLPIAEIKNAVAPEIFHTSFEDDGTTFTNNESQSLARTGTKAQDGSAYTFPTTYAPIEPNTLMSYWYWENNTWKFSGVVPFQRTIVTTGTKLDEVRAYPKNAQMSTYTFKPLYGVSSATDPNNNTSYYEYDEMGRLKLIRDDKGNIVKHYKYHYASQGQE